MFLTCLVGAPCGGGKRGMEVLLYRGFPTSIADGGTTQGVREAVGARARTQSILKRERESAKALSSPGMWVALIVKLLMRVRRVMLQTRSITWGVFRVDDGYNSLVVTPHQDTLL